MSYGTYVPDVLNSGILDAEHGFTTRAGGASTGPYASLNLGLSSGDEPTAVERNRDILLSSLGVSRDQVCAFNQVHGSRVLVGRPAWFEEDADAAVSDRPDLLLVVSAADCFPVLFHDPATGAVGAAHCGWRGTAARLVENVVMAMQREYGCQPADIRVAVGAGIRGTCYQVTAEVVAQFADAGFPPDVATPDTDGKYLLDLEAALAVSLGDAGVVPTNVAWLGRCTHCESDVFYSHRRDAGRTGRLWAFVRATTPAAHDVLAVNDSDAPGAGRSGASG